ncbi:MAG: ribosome maturation factor RimP [Actinobacteria bacterium]|nr:ribosome maturation factor RimP [Actinomycetota bacterium]
MSRPAPHRDRTSEAPVTTRLEQALQDQLEPVVADAGYDLEELRVIPAGKRRVVRLLVDADNGVELDAVAEVSRAVSEVLDEQDLMGDAAYVLEVSSPGVDRPLSLPRHWRRNVGRLVRVRFAGDREPVTGRLQEADERGAVLRADEESLEVSYDDVASAVVQVEFK